MPQRVGEIRAAAAKMNGKLRKMNGFWATEGGNAAASAGWWVASDRDTRCWRERNRICASVPIPALFVPGLVRGLRGGVIPVANCSKIGHPPAVTLGL